MDRQESGALTTGDYVRIVAPNIWTWGKAELSGRIGQIYYVVDKGAEGTEFWLEHHIPKNHFTAHGISVFRQREIRRASREEWLLQQITDRLED